MTAIRSSFGDLLAPGFREIFFNNFNQYPLEYTRIFNILESTRQYEDDSGVSGFGVVPEKDEGSGITYDDPIQGFNVRYTHRTFGLGFRVTREMWEDDLYNIMRKMPAALGRSMRISQEQDAANVLNRAFNSSYTGGDGKELCATDHPLTGGGTEQNELTTAADFSDTSLEQALIDIAATVDDRSLPINLLARKVIVHPSDQFNAVRVLKSELLPGSAQNDINAVRGIVEVMVNHYLTDTDAWFIQCDGHQLNWFNRRMPDFEQDGDFDTEDAKFKGTARWSRGFSDWRGFFGSQGA